MREGLETRESFGAVSGVMMEVGWDVRWVLFVVGVVFVIVLVEMQRFSMHT